MKDQQQKSLARRRFLQVGGMGAGFAGIVGLNGASFAQLFQSSEIEVPKRVRSLYRPQELLGAPHRLFASVDVAALQPHLSTLPAHSEQLVRDLTVAGLAIEDISHISGISAAYFSQQTGAGAAHITGDFTADEVKNEIQTLDSVQQAGTVGHYSTYRTSSDEVSAELAVSDSSLILGGAVGTDVDPTRAITLLSDAAAGDAKRYYVDSPVGRALIDAVADYPALGGLESGRLAPLAEVGSEEPVQKAVLEHLQGIGLGSRPVDDYLSTRTVLKYRSDTAPVSSVTELLNEAQDASPAVASVISSSSVEAEGSLIVVDVEIDPSEASIPEDLDEEPLSKVLLRAPALTQDSRVWAEIQQYLALFQMEEDD